MIEIINTKWAQPKLDLLSTKKKTNISEFQSAYFDTLKKRNGQLEDFYVKKRCYFSSLLYLYSKTST